MPKAYTRCHPAIMTFILLIVLMGFLAAMIGVVQAYPDLNHDMRFGVPVLLVFAVILASMFERMIATMNLD